MYMMANVILAILIYVTEICVARSGRNYRIAINIHLPRVLLNTARRTLRPSYNWPFLPFGTGANARLEIPLNIFTFSLALLLLWLLLLFSAPTVHSERIACLIFINIDCCTHENGKTHPMRRALCIFVPTRSRKSRAHICDRERNLLFF